MEWPYKYNTLKILVTKEIATYYVRNHNSVEPVTES